MFVSASTRCWPDLELPSAIELLEDLDFTAIEIVMDESAEHTRPSELLQDESRAIQLVRHTHRLDISGFHLQLGSTGEQHYEDFHAICRLAKATKVVNISVPSGEQGTPFNEEVEHLRRLVELAESEGVRVSVRCELGRLSEDPDTLVVLCNNVEGLGVTLDPSVDVITQTKSKNVDQILKFAHNALLRDTKKDAFQVSVGQGEVDYGKLVTQLEREKYDRALTIDMPPLEGHDPRVELRKLRRLLETLI
ncbi:MAG: TIM barrel protein [Planctomycetota bacterium]